MLIEEEEGAEWTAMLPASKGTTTPGLKAAFIMVLSVGLREVVDGPRRPWLEEERAGGSLRWREETAVLRLEAVLVIGPEDRARMVTAPAVPWTRSDGSTTGAVAVAVAVERKRSWAQ